MDIEQFGPHARFLLGVVLFGLGRAIVGAVILRAACLLFNTIAQRKGTQQAVPEPDLGKAMLIALVTSIAFSGVGFELGQIAHFAGLSGTILVPLISVPIDCLVGVVILGAFLSTTLDRAALLILITFAICIVVLAPVTAMVALTYVAIR